MSTKEQVRRLLEKLPDDCSIEDVQRELYLMEKIRRGFESIDRGEGIAHEDVKQRVQQWLQR